MSTTLSPLNETTISNPALESTSAEHCSWLLARGTTSAQNGLMPPRTTKPRSRKKGDHVPSLAVAHVVLRVANVSVAAGFYKRIGLRPVWTRRGLAILELRGGTHLLLFPTTGKRRSRRAAPFDLMAEDLDAMHATARAEGLAPTSIEHEERSGHRFFTIRDPDGHQLTVYSSHTEGRPV